MSPFSATQACIAKTEADQTPRRVPSGWNLRKRGIRPLRYLARLVPTINDDGAGALQPPCLSYFDDERIASRQF
jgi:hypothetical protein